MAYELDLNTKFMLYCNGVDASTIFTDASISQHGNATVAGTAQVDTALKKFGTGALLLDGNSDYLTYADSSDWDIIASNSDDWTIDFWIKGSFTDAIFLNHFEGDNDRWQIYYGGNILYFYAPGSGGEVSFSSSTITLGDDSWHHVAFVKVANDYAYYVDGIQIAYVQTNVVNDYTGLLYIGCGYWGGTTIDYVNGHMDEIRFQHSNLFSASPNIGKTNTITIPTTAYGSMPLNTRIRGSQVRGINFENESSSCDGNETNFELIQTPIVNSLLVFLNGLYQERGAVGVADYSVSGTTVTFTTAPNSGDILTIFYVAK